MEWNGGMIEDLSATHIIHSSSLNRIASHVNNILVILVWGVHAQKRKFDPSLIKGLTTYIPAVYL